MRARKRTGYSDNIAIEQKICQLTSTAVGSHLDGVACTETELLGSRTNWNRRIHSSELSGANFHCRAACNARLPKYRLDPIGSLIAWIPQPVASTLNLV